MTLKKIVYGIVALIIFVICLLPLVKLCWFALDGLPRLALTNAITKSVINTLTFASLTTLIALIIGTVIAYLLSRTDIYLKPRIKSFLTLPYIIPSYLLAIGWIILANPTVGVLNEIFPIFNIYGLLGIVFVESLFLYTFVFLNVTNALCNMDSSLEEAARMCGAGPVKIFFVITLPILKSTLLGSAIVVFMTALSSFGVPAMIGAPSKTFVLTTQIYQFIKIGTPEALERAAALSIPIIMLAFSLLYLSEKLLSKSGYKTLSGKHTRNVEIKLKGLRLPVTALLLLFVFVAVIMPLGTIFIFSLMPVYGDWNLSFQNYINVIFDPTGITLLSLQNSFFLAFVCATIIAMLALIAAYFITKTRFKFRNTLATLASLPYATPGTILAMALLFQFTSLAPILVIMIAYSTKYLSLGMKVITPSINSVDSSLEEASLMCGASWAQTVRKIWIPIMTGTIVTTIFLVFAPIVSELTMSILLVGPTTPTLGARLFQLQEYESPNQAAVLAVIILVIITTLNALSKKLSKGKFGI